MEDAVQLADVISQLRHELSRAMWAGEHADLHFDAETVQLELTVGVEKSREPGAAVRFWVFEASASARQTSMVTQRITLTLHPIRADRPGRPASIAGRELSGER